MKTFAQYVMEENKYTPYLRSFNERSPNDVIERHINQFFTSHAGRETNGFKNKHIVNGASPATKHQPSFKYDNALHTRDVPYADLEDLLEAHNGVWNSPKGGSWSGHIESSDGTTHHFSTSHGTNYSVVEHLAQKT